MTQISEFQFQWLDPTICIPFDRAHQTEQFCEDTIWFPIMICVAWRFEWIRPTKITKIKRIQEIFSKYSSWRAALHFCFLEYRAAILPCYYMGPWYTTHTGLVRIQEIFAIARILFDSCSLFVEWLLRKKEYFIKHWKIFYFWYGKSGLDLLSLTVIWFTSASWFTEISPVISPLTKMYHLPRFPPYSEYHFHLHSIFQFSSFWL